MDNNWRFQLHDESTPKPVPGGACAMAECSPSYDDSQWRQVNLPHDFVVEGVFNKSADKSHGYLPYGSGWYRHSFTLSRADDADGQLVSWIDFDGTQRDATAWLNGQLLGHHASGYTSYRFNASGILNVSGENVLVVFVDATHPDSWWYDGGGIYRSVWLNIVNQVHIAPWSLYAPAVVDNSTVKIRMDNVADAVVARRVADSQLHLFVDVSNLHSDVQEVEIKWSLLDSYEKVVSSFVQNVKLPANSRSTFSDVIALKEIVLWDIEQPYLYTVKCELLFAGNVLDSEDVSIGFRHIYFDANQGFFFNNAPRKLQGMANHQDFAGLGVAVPDNLQKYRVLKLKEMGANAWRTAHNPPNPALLDHCDREGMFVWDENHRNIYSGDWISDLESLILRDRNHPSIVLWSLCNEVLCQSFNASSAEKLKALVKKLDPLGGRLVSAAMNGGFGGDFAPVLDVIGVNYQIGNYDHVHKKYSNQPMIGSETGSTVSDRGIYADDPSKAYVQAYDRDFPSWANTAEDAWKGVATRDFMSGTFCWTGFDYKGEPTPYAWPNINSHFGVIDIAGFPKDIFFYYQSVWLTQPMVHVLPHWNWASAACVGLCKLQDGGEAAVVNVWVFTNGDDAELFLNGKSLGRQSVPQSQSALGFVWRGHLEWNVTFTPGVLSAVSYKKGETSIWAKKDVLTAMSPSKIQLETEFQERDMVLVKVRVVDQNFVFHPLADDLINFELTGPGKIIGLGNGDPSSHESDKPVSPQKGLRSVWNGLARVVVQLTGEGDVVLSASSAGLEATTLRLSSN
eukprot:TRINITY_DN11298_c0_g5_i1.p1 TRINITY_DN11298_c0_g5~~TRINITY_DN11298_c0_g5_i1.p1  ORF type:complete len:825 (-),score=214.28 TRINITY_DN11298_c0_g5_i1:967-3348(-)